MPRKQKNKQKQTTVLKPLPGFPRTKEFTRMEDVDAYLDGDKLTCLLCGREYISLHKHLILSHNLSADDYKEMFGLPWRRGLIARGLREKQRRIMNKQRKEGILPPAPSKTHIRKLRKSIVNRRPLSEAVRDGRRQHALRTHGRTEKWGKKDFEEYLRRIESGRTLTEVGKDADMPCREVMDKQLRENPALKRKFEKIWDNLPFAVQVRGQKTGPRFKKTVLALRKKGHSWPEIGRIMGVKEGTVRNTWFRLHK